MHPRVRRVVAALFAPWFAAVSVQPAAFHQCAMHSPGAARRAAVTASTAEAAEIPMAHAGHSMAGHTMPMPEPAVAHQHGAPASPAGPAGHAAPCTCDDGCCVASVAAAPPAVVELAFAPVSVRRERPLRAATGVALSATPHALPFANGPPARV